MKKSFLLLVLFLIVVLSGCISSGLKSNIFPKDHLCCANATITNVANIKDNLIFTTATGNPKEKRTGEITIKTDPGQTYVVDYEKYFGVSNSSDTARVECSVSEIGRRISVYVVENELIGVYPVPNDYLEKRNSLKMKK